MREEKNYEKEIGSVQEMKEMETLEKKIRKNEIKTR